MQAHANRSRRDRGGEVFIAGFSLVDFIRLNLSESSFSGGRQARICVVTNSFGCAAGARLWRAPMFTRIGNWSAVLVNAQACPARASTATGNAIGRGYLLKRI